MTVVQAMHQQFDHLLQSSDPNGTDLSPGQMLLMGFNGLFTKLERDFSTMLEQVAKVVVPDVWRKVDVVREARAIQVRLIMIMQVKLIVIIILQVWLIILIQVRLIIVIQVRLIIVTFKANNNSILGQCNNNHNCK